MQPFELVIMLIVADVASIPLADPSIPFHAGIVPILVLTFLHIIIAFICRKSIFARRIISGKPIMVIDKDGINFKNLKGMNMNMSDLIETLRSGGYFDFASIEYAIFETNGQICVVEKESDPRKKEEAFLPIGLIMDGTISGEGLKKTGVCRDLIEKVLQKNRIYSLKEILYMDIRQDGTVYASPKNSKFFVDKIKIKNEW